MPAHAATAIDPLPADALDRFASDGFVRLPGALTTAQVAACRSAFDRLLDPLVAAGPREVYEATRIIEREPAFLDLAAHPVTLALVRRVIGRDVTLASAGEAYLNPPGARAYISWHGDFQWLVDVPYPRQNFWVRATWFMDDVDADTGPMTALPGTHRETRPCPCAELTLPDGQPREMPGAVAFTGRAGDLVLNHTELWHTNTPNRSPRPRRLAMFIYKHAWMRPWESGEHEISPAFATAQEDPVRRQLCGVGRWNRTDGDWAL